MDFLFYSDFRPIRTTSCQQLIAQTYNMQDNPIESYFLTLCDFACHPKLSIDDGTVNTDKCVFP